VLLCEEELFRRLKEKNSQKIVDIESGVKYNEMIKWPDADFLTDTTKLSKKAVTNELLHIINDI
jgi:hypothetical protein